MTPLPEICKECRHRHSVEIGPAALFVISAKRCFVWNRIVGDNDSCQFFESREGPLHFQQLRSWVKRFEEVEGK